MSPSVLPNLNQPWSYRMAAIILVGIAVARILSTYAVFNQVWDEPISVACGMQWLDRGTYEYDRKHPPLGRVATAIGLYLTGTRSFGMGDSVTEGNALLQTNGRYWRNLAIARLGALPFFIFACYVVWAWAEWVWGTSAALLAVGLLSSVPPVLGHAGLAMPDVALMATLSASLFSLCLWFEQPSLRRSLLLGGTLGLAILSKLTALVFFPACGVLLLLVYRARRSADGVVATSKIRVQRMLVVILLTATVVWAGYRFSFYPATAFKSHALVDRFVGQSGLMHNVTYRALALPVPAPEFFLGAWFLWQHNGLGDYNYFLGERSRAGWLLYYPIVLAVKSPLPLLLLFGVGLGVIARNKWRGTWRSWTFLAAVAGVLGVGFLSHVNIGIRHLLPIYVMLCAIAALGALRMLNGGRVAVALGVTLLLWQAAESAFAHPDYLTYFNEFADGESGKFGVESDLDYGQDLARLATVCKQRQVGSLVLGYHGTADPNWFGFPPVRTLAPDTRETGWIAISIYKLRIGEEDNATAYSWLEQFQPVEHVGRSIRLYFIPATTAVLQ
ncbi:MAG TPA: glycosyltransferase family 39 protein [Bryobacteraceae bacterium]|nr:glycosyltransferase family 39 protein [Bryobacteraceae bacterium]